MCLAQCKMTGMNKERGTLVGEEETFPNCVTTFITPVPDLLALVSFLSNCGSQRLKALTKTFFFLLHPTTIFSVFQIPNTIS